MTVQIGPYRVEREIGRGANGVVLCAMGPHGRVALKLLRPERLRDPDDVSRFHREGDVAARLKHRGIVSLLDRGQSSHGPYHVYPYIEGQSLQQLVRNEGRLEPRRAATLVLELAQAMEHAHSQGVLHRDLKPANVLLTPAGEPRLTDFGLARDADSSSGLTLSGEVMGSPVFMPPEQALGQSKRIGPPADVYGVGAIFYTLLTGNPPISGSGVEEVLQRVRRARVVSPATVVPDVPVDLAAVCMRCLEKHPGDRYPSMTALCAALTGCLAPETPVAPSQRKLGLPLLVLGTVTGVTLTCALVLAARRLWFPPTAAPTADVPSRSLPKPLPEPDPDPAETVSGMLERAGFALARHDDQSAERLVAEVLKLEPDSGAAYRLLGKVFEDQGQRVEAIKAWGRAATLGDQTAEAELETLYPNPIERRLIWVTFVPEAGTLVEAVCLSNLLIDPELDPPKTVAEKLDAFAAEFAPQLEGLSGRERLEGLMRLTYESVIQGDLLDYYNPHNAFLASALKSKKGIHLTCATLLMALGERLGVELEGVCFPGWFLVRWSEGETALYLNSYYGHFLDADRLRSTFEKNLPDDYSLQFSEEALQPSSRQEIVVRLAMWLNGTYSNKGDTRHADLANELIELLTPSDRDQIQESALGFR